jgi:hypothetical protein
VSAARRIACADGTRWRVEAVARPSPYRLDLVFTAEDAPGALVRVEVEGRDLDAFTETELCALLAQARSAE